MAAACSTYTREGACQCYKLSHLVRKLGFCQFYIRMSLNSVRPPYRGQEREAAGRNSSSQQKEERPHKSPSHFTTFVCTQHIRHVSSFRSCQLLAAVYWCCPTGLVHPVQAGCRGRTIIFTDTCIAWLLSRDTQCCSVCKS